MGAENVLGISMPSRFSSQHSIDDAQHTAQALGLEYGCISIDEHHAGLEKELATMLEDGADVAQENIQARLRGILVMAHANAQGRMAIATGNKSELAQGYCTLYGDMAGGYTRLVMSTRWTSMGWQKSSIVERLGVDKNLLLTTRQ